MTQKKWRDIDKKSRELVKKLLRSIGATVISESQVNCSYDLKVQLKGKTILVEIKDRNFPHNRYGDVFCQEDKRTCNNRRIANGEAQSCIIINVFTDKFICIANVNDKNGVVKTMYCPITTLCDDRSKDMIAKKILSLPQTMKFKYSKIGKNDFKFERIR